MRQGWVLMKGLMQTNSLQVITSVEMVETGKNVKSIQLHFCYIHYDLSNNYDFSTSSSLLLLDSTKPKILNISDKVKNSTQTQSPSSG